MTLTTGQFAPSRYTPAYLPQSSVTVSTGASQGSWQTPAGVLGDTPQLKGDSALAALYANKLREHAAGDPNFSANREYLNNIPEDSLFGQWRTHLHSLIKSPDFQEWAKSHRVDFSKDITLQPSLSTITCTVSGERKKFEVVKEHKLLGAIWPLFKNAANALAPSGGSVRVGQENGAWLSEVARFHRETLPDRAAPFLTAEENALIAQQALTLETNKNFNPALQHEASSEVFLAKGKIKLGDTFDRTAATTKLIDVALIASNLSEGLDFRQRESIYSKQYLSPAQAKEQEARGILSALETTQLSPHSDSSYRKINGIEPGTTVSLKQYLTDHGMDIPKTFDELMNLGEVMRLAPPISPVHGNLGGALSWSLPLTDQERLDVRYSLIGNRLGLANLANYDTDRGVLGYLSRRFRGSPNSTIDPRKFINELLKSPDAKALGMALQKNFDAYAAGDTSINDWILGALGASLDRETSQNSTLSPVRTGVGGFDLAGHQHWGKPVSAVVYGLTQHLVARNKASPTLASVAAYLLLSRRAPAFLVKNIPDSVTCGSHTWVSFTTAVARIEAQTPGATSGMTFAEVMSRGSLAPVTVADRQIEYAAQQDALKDWGVANGLIPLNTADVYTDSQMNEVRSAFDAQIAQLSAASQAQSTPLPTREDLAIKHLKLVYGEHIPFEKKCITSVPEKRDFPGPYSVIDLYLQGMINHPPGLYWESSSADVSIEHIKDRANQLPTIQNILDKELPEYFENTEKSIATQVKHLIVQLPLEDRKKFEYGAIKIAKELYTSHQNDGGLTTNARGPHVLLVNTSLNGVEKTFEINLREQLIKAVEAESFVTGVKSNSGYPPHWELHALTPSGSYTENLTTEKSSRGLTPNNFSSERTRYIADALVEDTNIRSLKEQAQGLTTFDSEVPFYQKGREFLLNLIPLRSAIQNFRQGNIIEGIVDVGLDVFGFAVGVGAAARGAKALRAGASIGSKISHGAKILGRAAVGSLNPLSGLGDAAAGAARGTVQVGRKATNGFNQLRGTASTYDVIAASKRFEASAIGSYRFENNVVEGAAILKDGKWYSYDPISSQPFGRPLDSFLPSMRTEIEELGKWQTISADLSRNSAPALRQWDELVQSTKSGPDKSAFEAGYNSGSPNDIAGFSAKMKSEEVIKLGLNNTLTAEELGTLARQRERLAVQHGLNSAGKFAEDVRSVGGTVVPVPQAFYLSQANPLAQGQCAALSRVMANAMSQGKEITFIGNMYEAAANPALASSRKFISTLSDAQKQLTSPTLFHGAKPTRQMAYSGIVDELSSAQGSKTLMISTPDHALMAGVTGEGLDKKFFFYDPNFGLATFSSPEMMARSLEKIVNNKKLPVKYKTHSADTNKLEFKVSTHDETWMNTASVHNQPVKELYETSLSASVTNKAPSPVLTPNNAASKPDTIFVPETDSATVIDPTTVLTTRGISDCSAVVILSDLQNGIYGKRTLMHLNGSSLNELQSKVLRDAQASFADGDAKLIFVGGDLNKSPVAIGSALGQEHNGETLLADIVKKHPGSITITTASGIDLNPDGTYKLIEGNYPVSEFNQSQKQAAFDFID